MIWIDYAILTIVGISGILSLMRGFIREILSLAGWIAAFWGALAFSGEAAPWLEAYVATPSTRLGIAFVAIFVGILLLSGIALRLVGLLVERTGMSGTDRTLGILFGVLRGVVVVGLLVLLGGLTPLPQDPWWRESTLLPHFERVADEIRVFLPSDVRQQFRFDPEPEPEPEPEPDRKPDPEADPAAGLDGSSIARMSRAGAPATGCRSCRWIGDDAPGAGFGRARSLTARPDAFLRRRRV